MADLQFLAHEWPAISRRLDEALSLDPAERDPWLVSLAEPDSIKAKLRRLLDDAAGIETSEFLATLPKLDLGPEGTEDGDADSAVAGATVGPYRLLSRLGQGGMGTVWLAERTDGQPRRKVALKLPHVGWAPGLAGRMARERDILASLEHPNIARLYDAGVDPLGRPYLALEYVDGTPIDRYCTAHSLPLRERLALVLQVAAAVAHAHTRLVVHRDLKPSNILVTESGDVRLLDFGIAKLLQDGGESTELTHAGGAALTPDYASPEQIRGEPIGTPSDVYSLGVVTYELLAEVRPYQLAGARNLAEAIAETEPLPASRAAADPSAKRHLAGDLDAILNKVLKKGTEGRYPTVQAFAADIERHLRGEPVQARPNAPWYLAERWVRRHKLETGAAVAIAVAVPAGAAAQAAVLTALAAGAALALWQARVARGQAEHARAEATRAEQVKDFALSIFEGANTDSGAGAATTAADMLSAAQARVESELGGHPEIAVELMTAIGEGLQGLGRLDDADDVLDRAVVLARRELGADHPRTLSATVVHGSVLVQLDRPKEAETLLAPAVAEARRQHETHALVDALRWLGSVYFNNGELERGLVLARAAVDALSMPGGRPKKLDAVNAWASLASALNTCDRPGVADAARRALELAREVQGQRLSESVLATRTLLGRGLAAEGRVAEAIDELSSVLADTTRFLGGRHPMIENIANCLGHARLEAGDAAGALEAFRMQLATGERQRTIGSEIGMGHSALARALLAAGRNVEALEHCETSARFFGDASGPQSAHALRSLSLRALALTRLGRLHEAETAFEGLASAPWAGTDHAANAGRLAELRSLQGRHDEATALARTSLEELKSHTSKTVQARASQTLGATLLASGNALDAIGPLEDGVRLYARHQLVVSVDHADALLALARARAVA